MRLRVLSLVFLCTGAAAVWACSLNPQPLPPDTNDGGFLDSSLAYGPDAAGGGVDGSDTDAAPPPIGDDAGDASVDAADGSDASDASDDARDSDAATDAGAD